MVTGTEELWAELMRAANAGDAQAYALLLSSVAEHLRGFVRAGLARARAGSADIEDIVQETLLALHLKRHTWRETDPIRPWIYAIARYKLIDALRRGWRRAAEDIDELADTLAAEETGTALGEREIEKILATLPEQQRLVVSAISVEGRSIRETASDLNVNEGAVRVALHRGLKRLARTFGKSS